MVVGSASSTVGVILLVIDLAADFEPPFDPLDL
jgi:hypothetical protein